MNQKKIEKRLDFEKKLVKICKQRGWNLDELTTGQMLFILNLPEVKLQKKESN
jgi:hypothetical protein